MIIAITAADQMYSLGEVPGGCKMEIQIGVYGSGNGTIELQVTRPGGTARTMESYASNTDPDDLVTVIGPADDVEIGIPSGGTYSSGTVDVDASPRIC